MEIDKNQSGCVTQNHHQNDPSNVKKLQANNLASNNQGSNTEEVLTNSLQTKSALAMSTNSCKMRLIVLYTPAIDAIVGDILTMIQNTVVESNIILSNTLVNEEWELAYAGLTNYTEAYDPDGDSRHTDLRRFRVDGDGYMDEVHDLRERYSADICVLLSECQYTSQCGGVASGWDVGFDDAFALCHTYSWYISSFAHEIGHLLGGGHPIGYSPYTYGHGMHIP